MTENNQYSDASEKFQYYLDVKGINPKGLDFYTLQKMYEDFKGSHKIAITVKNNPKLWDLDAIDALREAEKMSWH